MAQTALITGASRGIGEEFARILAEDSIDLIVVARSEDDLNELKDELESEHGITVTVLSMDLASPESAKKLYESVQDRRLQVDILINNAGFGDHAEVLDTHQDRINDMIQLNMTTLSLLCRYFAEDMHERDVGSILNVSSLAAYAPGPYMTTYYATKAYVQSFSEALASELDDTNVSVTSLCPGPVKTGFQEEAGMEGSDLIENAPNLMTARATAEYGYRKMKRESRVAIPGVFNKCLGVFIKFFPRKWTTDIIGYLQGKRV